MPTFSSTTKKRLTSSAKQVCVDSLLNVKKTQEERLSTSYTDVHTTVLQNAAQGGQCVFHQEDRSFNLRLTSIPLKHGKVGSTVKRCIANKPDQKQLQQQNEEEIVVEEREVEEEEEGGDEQEQEIGQEECLFIGSAVGEQKVLKRKRASVGRHQQTTILCHGEKNHQTRQSGLSETSDDSSSKFDPSIEIFRRGQGN